MLVIAVSAAAAQRRTPGVLFDMFTAFVRQD